MTKPDVHKEVEQRLVGVLKMTQDIAYRYRQTLALTQSQLDHLLLCAAQHGFSQAVRALLNLRACPHVSDTKGRSALFLAVLRRHEMTVKILIDGRAPTNDGSLHVAACEEQWNLVQMLQAAGHSIFHRCALFDQTTVLEACIRHAYSPWPLVTREPSRVCELSDSAILRFSTTMSVLMREEHPHMSCARAANIVSVLLFVLPRQNTYTLVSELVSHLEEYTRQGILSTRHLFHEDDLRFSILALVERWPQVALNHADRQWLVDRMRSAGCESIYYVTEGDQPPHAIGVPARLVEVQKRRTAFRSKTCSVQVYCTEVTCEADIHAGLTTHCATTHDWEDTIICTDCLQAHLESHMFPLDEPKVKLKFPSTTASCWAPGCQSGLSHDEIKKYVRPEVFAVYDNSLLQRHLCTVTSTAKCANADCPGAIWFDEKEDPAFAVFLCLECNEETVQ